MTAAAGTWPPLAPAPEVARYFAYTALLDRLSLTEDHRLALRRRGLSDEWIENRRYRTLPGAEERTAVLAGFGDDADVVFPELDLETVPGFVRDPGGNLQVASGPGLLIPVTDVTGLLVALKVRKDGETDGAKYAYVSTSRDGRPSSGSPVHVPTHHGTSCETVRLTEGELKADVATFLSGVLTISVAGVQQWAKAVPVLQALGARKVLVAFDRDAAGEREREPCAARLAAEGFLVAMETWSPLDGKGVDDVLRVHGAGAVIQISRVPTPPQDVTAHDGEQEHPMTRVRQAFKSHGHVMIPTLRGFRTTCSAHLDSRPSLDVDEGSDGRVLVICRSQGCDVETVVKRVGLSMSDLFPPRDEPRRESEGDRWTWQGDLEKDVQKALARLRVTERARELLSQEKAEQEFSPPPYTRNLVEDLAAKASRPPVPWVIEGLHRDGFNASLVAQFKTGKTTFLLNLVAALADGLPFLGSYPVTPCRVGIWNFEMDEDQLLDWLISVGVTRPDRVSTLNLRNGRLPLDTPVGHRFAVSWLRDLGIEFLLIDTFAAAGADLADFNENSNSDAARYFRLLDEIKAEAGVRNLWLTAHTGRAPMAEGEERARGATRLDDWVDVRHLLLRVENARFHRAEGRGVNIAESALCFDPETLRLTYAGGTRADSRRDDLISRIVAAVIAEPGVNKSTLRKRLGGRALGVDEAIDQAVRDRLIHLVEGPNNSRLHFPGPGPGDEETTWS